MTKKALTSDPYENLATAIIVQAADDYREALKKLKQSPWNYRASDSIRQIEKFLHSPLYYSMTTVDGDYIIERIRDEVQGEDDDQTQQYAFSRTQ